MNEKWIQRYIALAEFVAQWSRDPSTKVGAVVVGKNRNQIAIGYNGFPPGISDTDERLQDRAVKYRLIQHAERNVLDNAAFDLDGATLITTLYPCDECAKSIVSKRIARVITPPMPQREPWLTSAMWAELILREGGVELTLLRQVSFAVHSDSLTKGEAT